MGDSDKQSYMRGQKTLEINPYHPLIQELKLKVPRCALRPLLTYTGWSEASSL